MKLMLKIDQATMIAVAAVTFPTTATLLSPIHPLLAFAIIIRRRGTLLYQTHQRHEDWTARMCGMYGIMSDGSDPGFRSKIESIFYKVSI